MCIEVPIFLVRDPSSSAAKVEQQVSEALKKAERCSQRSTFREGLNPKLAKYTKLGCWATTCDRPKNEAGLALSSNGTLPELEPERFLDMTQIMCLPGEEAHGVDWGRRKRAPQSTVMPKGHILCTWAMF